MKRSLLIVATAVLAVLALASAASAKVVVGTPGDDTLVGTDRRDFIYGRAGNDTMAGNGASDFLFGHRGDDTMSGDAGRDGLWGGHGNDTLEGGHGPDALYAGAGFDMLDGGPVERPSPRRRERRPTRRGRLRQQDVTVRSSVSATSQSTVSGCGSCGRADPTSSSSVEHAATTRSPAPESATSFSRWPGTTLSRGSAPWTSSSARRALTRSTATTARTGFWGGPGDDLLNGGEGGDWLWGGGAADQLFGEEGNDRLFAAADDGAVDMLDCGEHADDRDRAVLRSGDTAVNCERVRTLAS